MLKNIIFDFGDIFINLDKQAMIRELAKQDLEIENYDALDLLNNRFEVGAISPWDFVTEMNTFFPDLEHEQITRIWNAILLDFPEHRLDFLETLAATGEYRLFLLSNTNALHISKVIEIMGFTRFERFKKCFEKFYLSHEIKLRKPNAACFEYVLAQNKLTAKETLFIDDSKPNTDAAAKLDIQVWNLQVGQEDVTILNSKL